MANLMTASKFVKQHILEELKKGNMEVLNDLPPVMAMSYGIAMQNEAEKKQAQAKQEEQEQQQQD